LPQTCDERGLKSFGPEGPRSASIDLAALAEADRYGLSDAHLIGQVGNDPNRDGQAWVAARGAIYRLPDGQRYGYPLLDPSGDPGELRNAGYASEALVSPSGQLQVLLWIEQQLPEGAVYRALLATWDAGKSTWASELDLGAESGIAGADPKDIRMVSAAWGDWDGGADALWCVLSDGRVAVYREGSWIQAWQPEELGADPGSKSKAVFAVGEVVILATESGAFRRAPESPREPTFLIYIPRIDVRR